MANTASGLRIDFGLPSGIVELLLFFGATAFLGWLLESGYRSVVERRWVNAGFLHGPVVPVYGFACSGLLLASRYLSGTLPGPAYWAVLALLPSCFELAAGLILAKTVKAKLWDYSREFLNLKGYVCLKFSLVWAALAILETKAVQPFLLGLLGGLSERSLYLLGGALAAYLAMDTWRSISVYADFRRMLNRLGEAVSKGIPLPGVFGLRGKRLSLEWRRFLRPLRAFPDLLGQVDAARKELPEEILEMIHALRVAARHARSSKAKGDGKRG
jgi:uncharacterized membrane protein